MPKGQGTHSKVSNSYSWVNPVLQGPWSKLNHLRSLIKRIQITWTLSIFTEEWSMVHCMPCKTQILSKNEKSKFEIFCKGRPFDFHFRVGFPCRSRRWPQARRSFSSSHKKFWDFALSSEILKMWAPFLIAKNSNMR